MPACKCLITRGSIAPYVLPPLIEAIFSSKDESDMVHCLHGDDAQTFVDKMDEACSILITRHETWLIEINAGMFC